MGNLKSYSNRSSLSCSSRSTPIISAQTLAATIIIILLLSVMSLTPALASNPDYQAELNTLDSNADGAPRQLDIDKVTLYSAAVLGSTFLLFFMIRLIRLNRKKKQTEGSSIVKPKITESFIAAKCGSIWSTSISHNKITEPKITKIEIEELKTAEPVNSESFTSARCNSMWQKPVSRIDIVETPITKPFVTAKCRPMWLVPVNRQQITKPLVAVRCGPMWSQLTPKTTMHTAEITKTKSTKDQTTKNGDNKAKVTKTKVDKNELISLLKKHQKPGESLQATLDRLKESRKQRKKNTQQSPSVSKEELITLLKTQQKRGEALQATLDRIRKSKRPQESDTQVILRLCKT